MDRVAVRAGYLSSAGTSIKGGRTIEGGNSQLNNLSGLNMGFGLRLGGLQLDYALVPSTSFGETHHLSLSTRV